MVTRECNQLWHVVLLLPKTSIYRKKFSTLVMRMAASGLQGKYYNDEMDKKAILYKEDSAKKTVTLTLHHLQGAFLVYGLFIIAALLVFFIELMF